VLISFSICADSESSNNKNDLYEQFHSVSEQDCDFPTSFGGIIGRYEFDWIEEYIDEYYGTRYKHWERYLTSKQREIAGKFGLSNIYLKPNLRCYEDTRVVFSRNLWKNRVTLRYLAPIGDLSDFRLFMALKPRKYITLIAESSIDGESRFAMVVKKPFGNDKEKMETERQAKWLIRKLDGLLR
jgi:hypothetical protein